MAALLPSSGVEAATYLKRVRIEAIRSYSACENSHVYSSPLFLRRLLEVQRSDLGDDMHKTCPSHTMLLVPDQSYEREDESLLSILCAECRYHFHIQTYKGHSRALDNSNHPGHMLLPVPREFFDDNQDHTHKTDDTQFICAAEDCYYMVKLSVMPPKLTVEQVSKLQDDNRMLLNLQRARDEDPERFHDVPDAWAAGSTVPTLIKYIEDRLAKPPGYVLRIKKRNKKFRVAFGDDLDDLLRSLGFEEKNDDEGEECWYITEPETFPANHPTPVHTRRAHIQDTLEELRTLVPLYINLAWERLTDTFSGYLPRREVDPVTVRGLSIVDATLLGCLREFSPQSFSWAAILLADLCPSRRDEFLDAGLRCIQQRSEEASLNIIMYRSKFDEVPFLNPELQIAFEFFGVSPKDRQDTHRILNKYRTMVEADTSNSFKTKASQYLETISNHLGADLLGEIARGDSLATPSASSGNRRMSIASASRLLKVDSNFSADLIRDFAVNVDEQIDREKVIEAVEVLSELKAQQHQDEEAQSLKQTAEFLRATKNVTVSQIDEPATIDQSTTTGPATGASTPPGLKNIGNTCYLNSLLQYFYNVKAVREMILNYDQIQLELDDSTVNNRRTGGNGTRVTIEEAIVARQFVQELRRLFLELQATAGAAATPSQKLANTALSSAKEILTLKSQNQPPPLPARPSPAPPKEIASVNVNVEPVNETHDLASSASSRTLVNEIENALGDVPYVEKQISSNTCSPIGHVRELSPEDRALSDTLEHVEDVAMEDPLSQPPLSLEQKIAEVARRLEHSDRSGTSQQDVEEIIGNILEHLMRAIHPNGPMQGKPDLQADKVTELFFTTIVNTTIRTKVEIERNALVSPVDEHILNEEVVPERWITAFPHPDKEHKMKTNMYEALDRYFSYELLADGELARYTTIRALPPIVHICIQRSDASGVKNKNPVIIPEVLYLDRYMEADAGSGLWNTRRRVWAIKERIKELESRYSVENVLRAPGSQTWDSQATEREQGGGPPQGEEPIDLNKDLWRDLRPRSKRTREAAQLSEPTEAEPVKKRSMSRDADTSAKFADILWEAGRQADEVGSAELVNLRKEQADAFDSMKQHKYCLHAMICHAGGMNAGHYWVWVRDFKKQVWYKYNDSLVTEDSRESQQVIDELNTSGDPYYVAYVRDDLKDELVEVPRYTQRDDASMANASEVELEVIDSIVIDTPAQPANSPVNTAVEITMGDAAPLELQS